MEETPNKEIKGVYEDFIGIYKDAFPVDFCEEIIQCFEHYHRSNSVWCEDEQFKNSIAGRFDWAIDLANMTSHMDGMAERKLNDHLMECFSDYVHQYGHLKEQSFYSTTQKVQKTPAGGGYHVWHDESTSMQHCMRAMVWMVYLNDTFSGGETEFLYYHKRIQPEQGKLLIWPAGLTHAHRGGLVLEGMKYVVTGWFNVGD